MIVVGFFGKFQNAFRKLCSVVLTGVFEVFLPCVVPRVLAILHRTLEHQAVSGEDL